MIIYMTDTMYHGQVSEALPRAARHSAAKLFLLRGQGAGETSQPEVRNNSQSDKNTRGHQVRGGTRQSREEVRSGKIMSRADNLACDHVSRELSGTPPGTHCPLSLSLSICPWPG